MTRFIVFFDVESTGITDDDKIIQLSAIRYFGNKEVSRFDTYINPCRRIPAKATEINGITDDMVANAPIINEVQSQFLEFIQDAVLVGYNVSFDLRLINGAYDNALAGMEYLDVLPLVKRQLDLPDYRLESVANYLGFSPGGNYHNSLIDCEATADVFWKLGAQLLLSNSHSTPPYKAKPYKKYDSFSPKDIVPPVAPVDSSHPLYNKKIVFTGELSISRLKVAQMAVDMGASVRTSVSSKTDYLIVGKQDVALVGDDGMSSKEEKAHDLNALGKASIKIISEDEFISLVEGVVLYGQPNDNDRI